MDEYNHQEKFLKNSVVTLKKRLTKEKALHKEDNLLIMNDNIKYIDMITNLRTDIGEAKVKPTLTTTKRA
jgi:hypothetical protein